MDIGRFQRLQKPACQAQRHAVLLPHAVALVGRDAQRPRLGERAPGEVAFQHRPRTVLVHVTVGIHDAVPHPVLQRNAPHPAGLIGARTGVGHRRAHRFGLHRQRAVGEQPARPIVAAHAQRLADQQASEAGAIQEQVAFHPRAVLQRQCGEETAFRIGLHLADAAFDARDAEAFAEAAQEARVQPGVQVVGVIHAAIGQVREAAFLRRTQFQAVVAEVARHAALLLLQPEMLKPGAPVIGAGMTEGMDVMPVHVAPVF